MASYLWHCLPLVFTAAAAVACSGDVPRPEARVVLRIGTSVAGGGFEAFGQALEPALSAKLGRVAVEMQLSKGAVDNLIGVARGTFDCGFTYANVAYEAFVEGGVPDVAPDDIRAIALLQVTPVQLVASRQSRIAGVADLRGRRVALGGVGSATLLISQRLLEAHGISDTVIPARGSLAGVAAAMAAGHLDAAFDTAIYSEALATAVRQGAHVVPIVGPVVDELREQRPFIRAVLLPAGTYGPTQSAVPTIGVESLLVCRRQLADDVVRDLTQALVESLRVLAHAQRWNLVSLDQVPATSIPLHAAAAVYYREMELMR